MARAAWWALRAFVGFSDALLAAALPYAVLAAALMLGVVPAGETLALSLALAAAGGVGFVLMAAFEIRRQTGRSKPVAALWLVGAVLAGVAATAAAVLLSGRYTWIGWVALVGIGVGLLGVVVDLIACVVRAFGVGREHIELRPGLLALKVLVLAAIAWIVMQAAGRVGARELPQLLLMGFLLAGFAATVTAAAASPLFGTHGLPEESLPSPEEGSTISRKRGRGRRTRGRA